MKNVREVPISELSRSAFVRRLALGVLLLNLFVVILTILSLRQSRLQYEERAGVTTRNLSHVLEQHIGGSIDKIDLVLFAAVEEFEHQFARGGADRRELKTFLDRMVSRTPELDRLSVTDMRGDITYGTGAAAGALKNVADREYFKQLRDNPDPGLHISKPMVSRITGQWVIILARRISLGDGSFAGTVCGAISLEHFRRLFASIDIGPHGAIALRDGELGVIARFTEPRGSVSSAGRKKLSREIMEQIGKGRKSGTFKTTPPIDNIERIYTFRKLPGYPLYIIVGLAGIDYLAEWRSEAAKMSVAAILFFLVTLFTAMRIYRYWMKRNAAVRELVLARFSLDNAGIGIYNLTEDGAILSVNDHVCRSLGYSRKELCGMNVFDIDPAITIEKINSLKKRLESSGSVTHETIHRRKDGTTFPVEATTNYIEFRDKKLIFSYIKDITERKQAEQALLITQFSVDHASVPIFWIGKGSRFHYTNEACGYLGYTPAELRKMNTYEIAPEFSPEKAVSLYKELREKGSLIFEDVHKTKDGELIPVEITLNLCEYEDMEFHVAYVRNISERKKAEAEIARSGQKFRAIFENALDVIFLIDKDTAFVDCNPAAMDLFKCVKEDIIGRNPQFFSPPYQPDGLDSQEKARKIVNGAFEGKPQSFEWRHRLPDGSEFDVMVTLSRFELEGEPMLVAIVRDISRRKDMENALRLSTARFRELSDMLPEVIFECDLNGKLTYANKDAFPKYGYTEGELDSGIYLTQLVVPEDLGRLRDAMKAKFTGKDVKPVGVQYTTIRKDGTTIPAIVYSKAIFNERGPVGLRGIVVDISERILLEEQLYHAQKIEAVGQLAGGVAHDFNNILTAMIGFVHLILMKMKYDDPSINYVRQISILTERAAELTQGLLAFSRKQIMVPKPVDLNEIVIELRKMLKRLVRVNIELKVETSPGMLVVLADRGKMEQSLMNLVTNARDAIAAGGTITIKTSTLAMTEQFIREHGFGKTGNYACIAVSDTGCGINEEMKKKIFEPFFTTKEVGKGTGLGLSIVYGIIKQHNGFVFVCSEEDKGTTFNICIPLSDNLPETAHSQQGASGRLFLGNETLLLAEDDATLNNLHRELLEEAGYRVITAADGEEALEKFEEHIDAIDLLILDAVMPKFNGKRVLDLARTVKPGTNALFVSGYPADVLHETDMLQEGVEMLMKPITPNELLKKIREMLDCRLHS